MMTKKTHWASIIYQISLTEAVKIVRSKRLSEDIQNEAEKDQMDDKQKVKKKLNFLCYIEIQENISRYKVLRIFLKYICIRHK